MENKYLEYTVEEMVEDRGFLRWLNRHSENHELDRLMHDHPQFARKVGMARKMLQLLNVKEESVPQEDIHAIWENILVVDQSGKSVRRIGFFRSFLKYAAAVVLVVSLVSVVLWQLQERSVKKWYAFKPVQTTQQSRLILSSGEVIDLKKDESSIRVNAQNNAIRINNDSLVRLTAKNEKISEAAMNQVVVPYGKKSIVELADGTKVWLNAGSKMAFPDRFIGTKREVFLEGEAYFNVTPDNNRPFLVKTKEVVIKVLGTKFNVSAYEADSEVMTVLVEGAVSMRENKGMNLFGKEVILKPNQRAMFNKADFTTTVNEEAHAEIYTAWTEGWFPFYKEPLNNVFKKVERYYNVQFVYNEVFPSEDLISGKLDLKNSIDEVMKVLADVASISYKIDQNKIFIELHNGMPMQK